MFDVMIFRTIHIIAWFFVAVITTEHKTEGSTKLSIISSLERGYEGVPLDLTCIVLSGTVAGNIELFRPGNKLVLICDNKFTLTSCSSIVPGYMLKDAVWRQYVMRIKSFKSKVDEGKWICRDSRRHAHRASLYITSAPVYSITWNGLPQQKNYSDQYKMFVSGVCTVPQPKCDWSIKEVGKSKLKIPDTVKASALSVCDHEGFANCTLTFEKTPNAFLEKYLIFSVTISHPSIPDNLVTPEPTPVLFFPRVHVKLTTKKLFPPENEKIDLVCIVLQRGENMSGHDLDGTVYFYKWNKRGKPQKFAHIVQGTSGCSSMSAPSGYHITCGKGTSDLKSQKKYYRLWIESLKKEDYTNWYCHHEKTNTTSNHVVLAPFSVFLTLNATNLNPPFGSAVDLVCTLIQEGSLFGTLAFFRRAYVGKPHKFAQVIQSATGCTNKVVPSGYDIICGDGTDNITSDKKIYSLHIKNVNREDFTSWYCYQFTAEKASKDLHLGPISDVKLVMSTLNHVPLLNMTVYLLCTVHQNIDRLIGHVEFYRREEDEKPRKIGYAVQGEDHCSHGSSPSGYEINCGEGTNELTSKLKTYSLVIKAVQTHDYTSWYCYHTVAKEISNEIRLETPLPDNPEQFVSGLGGAMMAVIIVSALMAAAVPAAASGAYIKRNRKRQRKLSNQLENPVYSESNADITSPKSLSLEDLDDQAASPDVEAKHHHHHHEPHWEHAEISESDFWHSYYDV